MLKLNEQSFISLGLVVVLCGVAWRMRGVQEEATLALREVRELQSYIAIRRDRNDDRWLKLYQRCRCAGSFMADNFDSLKTR